MVSVGRPSGALIHSIWPFVLSKLMKRCAPPAYCPQENVRPLTITWLPSTIGEDMRPPCVVHMPTSSARERSQRTLPAGDSAISRPLALIAMTLPDAGSTAGEDQ